MVECNLPKVDVAGSSPVFRFFIVQKQGKDENHKAEPCIGSRASELSVKAYLRNK